MKIVKSCPKQEEVAAASPKTLQDVPIGTIFRYNDLGCGPYLRVNQGVISLDRNTYYADSGPVIFTRYVPLPNAYLVTGEQ